MLPKLLAIDSRRGLREIVCKLKVWSMLCPTHYSDVIMGTIASQITSLTTAYSTVYSDADQRKHQSSASLAFVRGIHREPVNSPHKWPVTRKMFPFDDVIMLLKLTSKQNTLCFHSIIASLRMFDNPMKCYSYFCGIFGYQQLHNPHMVLCVPRSIHAFHPRRTLLEFVCLGSTPWSVSLHMTRCLNEISWNNRFVNGMSITKYLMYD